MFRQNSILVILLLFFRCHFVGKPELTSQNVGCFLRLQIDYFSEEKTLNEHVTTI